MKEYAQVDEVLAGFGVDSELASDLSRGIRVSETAEYWEKVDLVPGKIGTGTCLMHADS
jgi:hypothetical protein